MLKSVFTNFGCKRRFAKRAGKVHKYLPTPVKTSLVNNESLHPPTKIDIATAELLERLSLVGIKSEKAVEALEEAIAFADQILTVNTTKAKPLYSVLEDESLYLREDASELSITRSELISQCEVTQANYFVTPLGNLEYVPEEKSFLLPELKQASNK